MSDDLKTSFADPKGSGPGVSEDTPPPKNKGGRPRKDSIRLTRAARERLDTLASENADAIFQAILGAALAGDMTAARLLADRIWPQRKGSVVNFTAPVIAKAEDIAPAYAWLLSEVAEGHLTPEEAGVIDAMIERRGRAFEMIELAREVDELKQQLAAVLGPRAVA